MLIYKKYIIKSILSHIFTFSCVLVTLTWITQIFKLLYLIEKGIAINQFFKLTLLVLPSLFLTISPIITALATIYVYNNLQYENQLIIFKTSGFSNFTITKPALLVATIITIFAYYISLYLVPLSYNKMQTDLNHFRETYVSNIITEKTFNQISKYVTIYVNNKNEENVLEGIILFDNKISEQKSVLFAKLGKIISDEQKPIFHLQDGFRHCFDKNGNLTKLFFDNLFFEINSKKNIINNRNKKGLYIHEMFWNKDSSMSQEKKERLIVDGHQRLIWPLFNYCLTFLALSIFLSLSYNRKSNIRQILFAVIPLISIIYLHFTFQKIAYQNPIYILACYLNIMLGIIISLWFCKTKY